MDRRSWNTRQVRTEKGYKPDSGVVSQIKVIKRLFDTSEHIIVCLLYTSVVEDSDGKRHNLITRENYGFLRDSFFRYAYLMEKEAVCLLYTSRCV